MVGTTTFPRGKNANVLGLVNLKIQKIPNSKLSLTII